MQYTVVVSPTVEALIEQVNRHVAEGWTPQGGVCLSRVVGMTTYLQAMTRDQKK